MHYPFIIFLHYESDTVRNLHSFPTRRSSDLGGRYIEHSPGHCAAHYFCRRIPLEWQSHDFSVIAGFDQRALQTRDVRLGARSEEHTSELQSRENLVCRLLLEKKKNELNKLAT